jgi:hypothetical protein
MFRRAVPEHSIAPQRGFFSTLLLAVLLPTALLGGPALAAAPPSAEVFGALPQATDVVMTPNGQRLAWVDEGFAKPRGVMFDIAARKELRILALPERLKVRGILWNDDETLIIMFSETQSARVAIATSHEYFINIAYDASGGEGRLLPLTKGNNNDARSAARAWIVRARLSKPHTVIMATWTCHNEIGCLIEVDTNTGEQTVIKSGGDFRSAGGSIVTDCRSRARIGTGKSAPIASTRCPVRTPRRFCAAMIASRRRSQGFSPIAPRSCC